MALDQKPLGRHAISPFVSWRHTHPPIIAPTTVSLTTTKSQSRAKTSVRIHSIVKRGGRAVNIFHRIRHVQLTSDRLSPEPPRTAVRRPSSDVWVFSMPSSGCLWGGAVHPFHAYATGHPCGASRAPSSPRSCVRTVLRVTSLSVAKPGGGV